MQFPWGSRLKAQFVGVISGQKTQHVVVPGLRQLPYSREIAPFLGFNAAFVLQFPANGTSLSESAPKKEDAGVVDTRITGIGNLVSGTIRLKVVEPVIGIVPRSVTSPSANSRKS
jgi:hypothetical protein